jgi:hypothetical protein
MDMIPHWTSSAKESAGRDPLGIQATSVRMYRTLVPGLTNVTNRLRYYSYYCWVVYLWQEIRHEDNLAGWYVFIRRAEALYALACEIYHPGTTGLAGSDWARDFLPILTGTTVNLRSATEGGDAKQYLKAKRGNFGQFYVASMQEVGLLEPNSALPIVTEDGGALAIAFGEAIGKDACTALAVAINRGEVATSDLARLGEVIHPSAIVEGTDEMLLLREFLWPKSLILAGSEARRTSAWLLLDLANQGVDIGRTIQVRNILYDALLPNGSRYQPGGAIIQRWRAYQANEFCHVALEAFLNGMTALMGFEPAGIDPATLLRKVILLAFEDAESVAWLDWAMDIAGSEESETLLVSAVLEGLRDPGGKADKIEVLLNAAKILGILWVKWSGKEDAVKAEIATFSARPSTSLAGVVETLTSQNEGSVLDALEAVLLHHVIVEHLLVAGRKFAASARFTFRFTFEDGLLSNGILTEYRYTTPRLANLFTFLVDAKLVGENGEVTATGKNLLNDFKPS